MKSSTGTLLRSASWCSGHGCGCALCSWTVAQLKKVLELNDQKRSGVKVTLDLLSWLWPENGVSGVSTQDELVTRCVDGALRGALPKCPQCKQGALYYAGGLYHCAVRTVSERRSAIECLS